MCALWAAQSGMPLASRCSPRISAVAEPGGRVGGRREGEEGVLLSAGTSVMVSVVER